MEECYKSERVLLTALIRELLLQNVRLEFNMLEEDVNNLQADFLNIYIKNIIINTLSRLEKEREEQKSDIIDFSLYMSKLANEVCNDINGVK